MTRPRDDERGDELPLEERHADEPVDTATLEAETPEDRRVESQRRPTPPPAAPVVTDEGVYGTLPERRWAEREYAREERPWRDTLVRFAAVVLTLSAAAWLGAYSAYQATSAGVARPAHESLVATMTGLSDLLVLHEAAVRDTGEVPGFPLPVAVPAADRSADAARWREVVLQQSSALLYEDGADAFRAEGEAGAEGAFSTSGGIRLLINNLSSSRNALAQVLLWPAGLIALVAALGVVALGSSFRRVQTLGIALAFAAVPAIGAGLLAYGIVAFVGSDGSALAERGHEIAWALAGIPFRNGLTLLAAGVAVALLAKVAAAIFDRRREPEPLYDYE